MNPSLSIIVPVYNVRDYLRECIDSLLSQSYRDFEIILVDDGSTDGSGKICDEYQLVDNRIRTIHKDNGGLSSSRNAALDVAAGEYLTFVDSDDVIIGTDVFERIMACFVSAPDVDIIQYDVIHKYTSTEEHKRQYPFKTYNSKCEILEGYLNQAIHVSCCDKIFKAKIFEDLRFPEKQISEDIAVIPQIVEKTDKLIASEIGYYGYRYREGSITNSALPYTKIVSILRSYYTFLNYAIRYSDIKPIAIETYIRVGWNYLSVIRTNYASNITSFSTLPIFIRMSISQWIKTARSLSAKDKVKSFVFCCLGPRTAFRFQSLFTKG